MKSSSRRMRTGEDRDKKSQTPGGLHQKELMLVVGSLPSLSWGSAWIWFYAFSHSHLLPSPCSQGGGERCPSAHQGKELLGAVRPFPSGTPELEFRQLGHGHLSTGHLLNTAQPCPGQGQPSYLLGPDTLTLVPSRGKTIFTGPWIALF